MRPRSAVLLLVPLALLGCKKEDKVESFDIKFTATASLDPNGGEQVHFEIDTLPNMEVRFYSNAARTDAKGHATIDAHLFLSEAEAEASEVDVSVSGTLERKSFLGPRTLIIATGKEKVRRPPRIFVSRNGFSCLATKEPCSGTFGVSGLQFATVPTGTKAEALGKTFTATKARDETFPLGLLEKAKDVRIDGKGDMTFASLPVPVTLNLPDGAKASGTFTLTSEIWKAYLVSTLRDTPGKPLPFPGESAAGASGRSMSSTGRRTRPRRRSATSALRVRSPMWICWASSTVRSAAGPAANTETSRPEEPRSSPTAWPTPRSSCGTAAPARRCSTRWFGRRSRSARRRWSATRVRRAGTATGS